MKIVVYLIDNSKNVYLNPKQVVSFFTYEGEGGK